LENLKGRDSMGDQGVYEMIILKWFLKKQDMRMWIGFILLRIGTIARLL
jgi:hypothetical protein